MSLLRKLFGPSQEEIWRQLTKRIDAQYVDGGFWNADRVVAQSGQWTVTLDTYAVSNGKSSTTYTRMYSAFENPDGFRFAITRDHLFSGIARALGFQDIVVGDPAFDEAFVIKGNDEARVKALLSSFEVRQGLFDVQPHASIEVMRGAGFFGVGLPEGVDQLRLTMFGVVKELDRLHAMFDLFAATLHQLGHLGSAYEDDPRLPARA